MRPRSQRSGHWHTVALRLYSDEFLVFSCLWPMPEAWGGGGRADHRTSTPPTSPAAARPADVPPPAKATWDFQPAHEQSGPCFRRSRCHPSCVRKHSAQKNRRLVWAPEGIPAARWETSLGLSAFSCSFEQGDQPLRAAGHGQWVLVRWPGKVCLSESQQPTSPPR